MKSIGTGTPQSTAFCLPAVTNALRLANTGEGAWITKNDTQVRFLTEYGSAGLDLASLDAYLKGFVTKEAALLNEWFAENGWPGMNLNFPPIGLGIGSIFDLLVDWERPGEKKAIGIEVGQDLGWYEGVTMRRSSSLTSYTVEGHEYPMFEIATRQDDWKVYLVESPEDCDPLDLPAKAMDLLRRGRTDYNFQKLEFPIVEMAADVNVSWLKGMQVEGLRQLSCRSE